MHFNSIKVQLERVRVMSHCTCIQNFNSIKVQLEQTCCAVLRQRWRNFNSIKVQLELYKTVNTFGAVPPFQFHKGTIRTHGEPDTDEAFEYFNSIKVQLEPYQEM